MKNIIALVMLLTVGVCHAQIDSIYQNEELETIYCLSNAFATEFTPDNVFSFVVIKDDNNKYT